MLTQSDVNIFSTVSFEVYPAQILGTGFHNAKVMGIIDADTARRWIDPVAMHAAVYPTLPEGSINQYDQYLYLKLLLANGQTTAIGLPWIRDDSYVVNEARRLQFIIENVTADDEPRIRRALSANGFEAIQVKYLD